MAYDWERRFDSDRGPSRFALASPVRALCLGFALCLAFGPAPRALAQSGGHVGRKIIRSERPDYPLTLKNAGIGGVVRLNASVLANGTVARVVIIGGNPILAESAAKAVTNWKYAPGSSTTSEIITFDFNKN
ncbi:MAG: energy transducer TonB [Terriglobales bacterium]